MDPPRDAGAFDRWDPVRSSLAGLNVISSASNIWWTRRTGRSAVDAVSRARFQSLVQFARERSRFYREALSGLPQHDIALGMLPVTTKRQLMARFDDWVTDPKITRTGVHAFLDSRDNVGRRYLDRYLVWKSSGTGGEPGIFIQDPAAIATYDALMSVQLEASDALALHRVRIRRAWRTCRSRHRNWRSLRRHCVMATRDRCEPVARGPQLFGA